MFKNYKNKKRNTRRIPNGKIIHTQQVTCPYCKKEGVMYAMVRWHFKNCKMYDGIVIVKQNTSTISFDKLISDDEVEYLEENF